MPRPHKRRQARQEHTATITTHQGRTTKAATTKPPRFRPRWHQAVGAGVIAGGAGLFFSCELSLLGIHRYGGHVWYAVGIALAASSLWWFGAFDPAGSGFA